MAQLPKTKKQQVYDKSLDGVYGRFKTKESFPLDYLLTSIKMDRISWLETASDVLDIESISFEEIVQRDIDYVRVQKEIIEKYLEKGKNRVLFFPPVMVTLFGIDDGKPISTYTTVHRIPEDGKILTTYDKNRFQTELPLSDEETLHSIKIGSKIYHYVNYAATLRYNSARVRMVVLDGQHRLTALKKLIENRGIEVLSEIELPICIFFPPDKTHQHESLLGDMRELFVTINKEAKEVSGHFIWLLKDRSLAAISVRDLGDTWKRIGGQFNYLHQLEWNQREAALADQTQKDYSITTVSILAEALKTHIYTSKPDYTYGLLNLSEVEAKLQATESSRLATGINEDSFDLDQVDILKQQIHKYITPSLDVLFRTPSPFRIIRQAFEDAVEELEGQVAESKQGAAQFKYDVLGKFRGSNDLDHRAVQDQERTFTSALRENKQLQEVQFFRKNVFHQAFIRAWADIFHELRTVAPLTPKSVAEALVAGMEVVCFDTKVRYFDPLKAYAHQVIYRGERILVSDLSKRGIRHLIVASLMNEEAANAFVVRVASGGEKKELRRRLMNASATAGGEYFNIYFERQRKWLLREFRFADISERDQQYLEERFNAADGTKEKKEFENRIDEIAAKRLGKAKEVLANVLKLKRAEFGTTPAEEAKAVSDLEG